MKLNDKLEEIIVKKISKNAIQYPNKISFFEILDVENSYFKFFCTYRNTKTVFI